MTGFPLEKWTDHAMQCAEEVSPGRIPLKTVNHAERHRVAGPELRNVRTQHGNRGSNGESALRQKITGNPGGADVTPRRAGLAAPGRVIVHRGENLDAVLIVDAQVRDELPAFLQHLVFHFDADRLPDVGAVA